MKTISFGAATATATATLVALTAACGGGKMNASFVAAGSGYDSRAENQQTSTARDPSSAPPEPIASAAPAAPIAPVAPPADACPLVCNEQRGPVSVALTAEEHAQLRTALEPLFSRLRSCMGSEGFRRRSSPAVQLRIGPDGSLTEHGVAPDDLSTSCFEDASRGTGLSVSLPGRKSVRCVERCVVEGRRPGRRGR